MFLNFLKRFLVDLQPILTPSHHKPFYWPNILTPEHVEKLKHLEEVWIYRAAERPVNEALVIC